MGIFFRIPLWLKLLGLAAVLLLAFFIFRAVSFTTDDIVLEMDLPAEMDIGSDVAVHATVTNSTRTTLRSGSLELQLPQGIQLVEAEETTFKNLAFRGQHTATFRILAEGSPGDSREITAKVAFRPWKLSASFAKEIKQTVQLRELPFTVSFSFPSDVTSGRAFTFFIRYASQASEAIGPMGLALQTPETFRITRSRPVAVPNLSGFWDFGVLNVGARGEVAVTGSFDAEATGGEFIARVGVLNDTRRSLESFKETREFLNLHAGAVPVDVIVQGIENPRDVAIRPGEIAEFTLRYSNLTVSPVEDLSISLAFAHEAIDQRDASSSEEFRRSISGEYVWGPDTVLPLRLVAPGASGTITFSAKLEDRIPMESFSDANQTITARARAVSGGEILGERQVLFKIENRLGVEAEVLYANATGGNNTGPIPPRVGQQTTYTVTLTVTGGTNGVRDTVARVVLGPGVTYGTLIEPETANVLYDGVTREVRWDIGEMLAGVGILAAPKTLTFRILLTPRAEDVGKFAELLSIVTATGTDSFTERTLDASDDSVDTSVPDDGTIGSDEAIVQP